MYDDPLLQFQKWFTEALNAEIDDVNAMALATVDANQKPHCRIVLLKGLEQNKFVFYTNYESQKGKDIEINPHVALTFYWVALQRQIRIEGIVEKIESTASDKYFASRPFESQLGACASLQSQPLANRSELEQRFEDLKKRYLNNNVPRPTHWGGYAVNPSLIEFWQGRANRLHDRIVYNISDNNTWIRERLYP
jgi:Pyridoxamine 5'-phosphate oxidase (EC 1.4.3.5)